MYKKNLMPHVHVIKLVGGTGNGKTEIAVVFASPKARKILLKGVGRTNSTLRERLFVYTTAVKDKIVIAVSMNDTILDRGLFTDIVVTALAKVVKTNGKVVASMVGKDIDDLEQELFDEINKKNNTRAVLSFLTEEQKSELVKKIIDVYKKYDFHQYSYEIYNGVKNNMAEIEVKDNSAKFLSALKLEVERVIDLLGKDFRNSLWEVWKDANEILKGIFFDHFNENDRSEDGLYYKEIDLDNPDEEFIINMFSANNLQAGENLSLEVLCGEIYIYAPINDRIVQMIESDEKASRVFKDAHGEVAFGIYDTRGLYHADNKDDDNKDYLSELLYQGETDALAMVVPMQGDSNELKIYELYREALNNYKKQIPVFMINNKVDLYIDSVSKDSFSDDPLSMDISNDEGLDSEEIERRVNTRLADLKEELQKAQNKTRKNMDIIAIPCYLKRDGSMKQKDIIEKYNVINAIEMILIGTASYLEATSVKIPIRLIDESDVTVSIKRAELKKQIHEQIFKDATDKKVFAPGMKNISSNMGITPHGNGYNALRRRIKYGDGYSSNIDENYYYTCKSFSIEFTGNLRNFISDDMISYAIHISTSLENGKFITQKDMEAFWNIVKNYINPRRLVSILLYDNAMLEAEKIAFGFQSRFRGFLTNSMAYFDRSQIDEDKYVEALETVIKEAVQKAIAMNVIYK